MRIKYHRQHNNRRRFSQLILLTVGVLVIIAGISTVGQLRHLSGYLYASALSGVDEVSTAVENAHGMLTPKSTLLKENQKMRTTIQELTINSLYNSTLLIENQRLRALLSPAIGTHDKPSVEQSITARIIDYKSIPYGTILADIETSNNALINIGAVAHFGNLAIGTVERVDGRRALIRLFTASGESYSALVGQTVSTFNGTSNDSGQVITSRTEKVELGTVVSLPYAGGLIIGYVEDIDRDAEDSMQTLLIRAPVSISQLHFISITNE